LLDSSIIDVAIVGTKLLFVLFYKCGFQHVDSVLAVDFIWIMLQKNFITG
jgi:hypothetical protein